MNATKLTAIDFDLQDDMLIEVDFKWLMAGQGYWVDTTRLRTDSDYAHTCVEQALHSHCSELQRFAHAFDMPANARVANHTVNF
jgi:hypothetical protein